MHRIVVTMFATLVVATPLGAQVTPKTPPKDSTAQVKPGQRIGEAAGEVVKKDTTAKKDSAAANLPAAAKDSTRPADSLAANPVTGRPTFRCKDGTMSSVADSAKACGQRGGVDSVFKKPTP